MLLWNDLQVPLSHVSASQRLFFLRRLKPVGTADWSEMARPLLEAFGELDSHSSISRAQ